MKKRALAVSSVLAVSFMSASFNPVNADNFTPAHPDYSESTEITDGYSDCGYSCGIWINAAPGKKWSAEPSGISLLLIDIGAYSSGINSEQKDYDLDDAFFESLGQTLENAKKNDSMVGIRLRYDSNGKEKPEPASFEKVLDHVQQLSDSGLLYRYEENIAYIESGLVGAWGEQWGGKYTSADYKAKLLDKFLDITPDTISVSVRTPDTFRQWLKTFCSISVTANDMSYEISDPELAAKARRVGLYNDGYMGSDSDLGTYSDRKGETEWIGSSALYGGEFSGNDEWRLKFPTWLPENALPEMYRTKLSRINCNIWKTRTDHKEYDSLTEAQERISEIKTLYENAGLKDFDFDGKVTENNGKYTASWKWIGYDDFKFDRTLDSLLNTECDNSAFYGTDLWQYIRTHLGYRFVLKNVQMPGKLDPGENFSVSLTVENTGFSETPKNKEAEIILSDGVSCISYRTDINVRNWLSGRSSDETIDMTLPENISGGSWDVYLRISELNRDAADDAALCTRFSNNSLRYSEELGANYLGSIDVTGKKYERPDFDNGNQADGYYPGSVYPLSVNDSDRIQFLDRNYTFSGSDHYGLTFLYKVSGLEGPVQLGDWYLRFSDSGTGYSSAYTTYGLNTLNLKLTENGYYAMNIPFYSAVFNFPGAAAAGSMTLHELNINDSRNYWSSETFTDVSSSPGLKITPAGFAEGASGGYSVTFHMDDKDYKYTGNYGFSDKSSQTISNVKAVSVYSLADFEFKKEYRSENGFWYRFAGFTTVKDDRSSLVSEDRIAFGEMDLYPYFEPDTDRTDFNSVSVALSAGTDSQGIKYTTDEKNMTASAGSSGAWKNNSFCTASGKVYIPAFVISEGKKYRVVSVSENAFSGCTDISEIILPSSVSYIGENAFYKNCTVGVYENSKAEQIIRDQGYTISLLHSSVLKGDINSDGSVNAADLASLIRYLLSIDKDINYSTSDMDSDGKISIADLVLLKSLLLS